MTYLLSNFSFRPPLHWGFSVWLAACSPPRAPGAVPAPVDVTKKPSVEPTHPPLSPAPQEPPPAEVAPPGPTFEQVIKLVARRGLWPLEPAKAEALLRDLGPVHREEPSAYALLLSGGPSGVVARFQVLYSGDGKGNWTLEVASFFLRDADLQRLRAAVERQLSDQLGKAEWRSDEGDFSSSGWGLGDAMALLLGPSPIMGEKLLMVSISEPEGEEE